MKSRITLYALISLLAALCIISSKPAHAAGITVGASSWYAWWQYTPNDNREFDPGLIYGPVVGFDFADKWSLSSVFLTGAVKESGTMSGEKYEFYYRRYDSDTVISYNVNRWLKVFGGLKYIRFDYNVTSSKSTPPFGSAEESYSSMGPGIGIGLTLPVTDSLFFLTNFSGMYCFGTYKAYASENDTARDIGFNSNVSLAYHIASMATTISSGFRFQYLDTKYSTNTDYNSKTKFYGITLMATYHLSLDSE
jgi:hypothetical protein